jgi:transcriptional regulator with XRE-family HTH domain
MLESLGEMLRAAREARGWTLEEVERVVHIRARYLAALEAGDLQALPSMLQARGFLRNYAQHLGLKPDQVLEQLDEALAPPKRRLLGFGSRGKSNDKKAEAGNPAANRVTVNRPSSPVAAARRLRRLFTPDIIIAFIAIVVVIGFLVWGGMRLANTVLNPSAVTPTAEVLGPTVTLPATPTLIANITPTATLPGPGLSFTNVQLTLIIEKRTFIRVITDDTLAFEGIVFPDEKRDFVGVTMIEVTTGDGDSVRMILNQQDLGLMGTSGEVVSRQFTSSGMITLTPTITFTPSQTLTPSETPTLTPVPTETPSLTPSRTTRP